jgi:hypothetical protein
MKIWAAILPALFLATVKSLFVAIRGVGFGIAVIDTAIFLISLMAFIKLWSWSDKSPYLKWALLFLVTTIVLLSLAQVLFSHTPPNLEMEMTTTFKVVINFVAGAAFGFACRFDWKSHFSSHR